MVGGRWGWGNGTVSEPPWNHPSKARLQIYNNIVYDSSMGTFRSQRVEIPITPVSIHFVRIS